MTTNHAPPTDTILCIHGLWMTPRSWEKWMERYESRGYRALAPSWPGLEGEVEALNRDSTPLTKLDVTKVVDHYDGIIRVLDSAPIIVGHSLGGTIVQLLLARGLPAAGVGVAPGTVRGVPDLPHFPGAPGWEEVADYFGVRIADGAVKVAPSEGVVQSPQPVDVRRQRTGR